MKWFVMFLGIVIVCIAAFTFINKYYPSLPMEQISAREVIEKLKESDRKIVEIAADDETIWYLTRIENQGILSVDENIKQMVGSNGWEFIQKDGSGL